MARQRNCLNFIFRYCVSCNRCTRSLCLQGVKGFYKGITASYFGISETVVHFVIYEAIKARLIAARVGLKEPDDNSKSSKDFLEFMMAGAISKTVASCIAYPHGW